MNKDASIFVGHILESIDHILIYSKDVTKQQFKRDDQLQDSVIRRIEIIGEATKNLPIAFRKKHHHIPWKKLAGMRDMVIHEYFGIDLNIVWDTIKRDLPKLQEELEIILEVE